MGAAEVEVVAGAAYADSVQQGVEGVDMAWSQLRGLAEVEGEGEEGEEVGEEAEPVQLDCCLLLCMCHSVVGQRHGAGLLPVEVAGLASSTVSLSLSSSSTGAQDLQSHLRY